jgi:hypothetical protein
MSTHSIFSPSSSSRWLNCPGSIKLIQKCPPDKGSPAAQEGTDAHALAEMCFAKEVETHHFIGEVMPSWLVVNKAMAKHVQTYLDYVKELKNERMATVLVEKKLTLNSIDERVYGTADIVMIGGYGNTVTLDIFDFKYGKWAVEVKGNTQLMIYALGALEVVKLMPYKVTAHICQPRSKHKDGINRSCDYLVSDLIEFGKTIKAAVVESDKDEPELFDGDHCRFCPAELICPKLNSLGRAIQI